ncbi:TonB-dependent receptor [Aestuariibaculum suncheonense]
MIFMRTFIFLTFCSVFSLTPNAVLSQNFKIFIDSDKTITIDELFKLISDQTDYKFIYQDGLFKDYPKAHLKKGTIKANDLLKNSIANSKLNFEIINGNTIVIKEQEDTSDSSLKNQQENEITGVILDSEGIPIPGANVVEVGSGVGVMTDFDGKFTLTLQTKKPKIKVSFVGYTTLEVNIGSKRHYELILETNTEALDDVVVVGFGKQKEASLVSAVSTVKGEQLRMPNRSLSNNLAGQIPGLIAIQRSGEPGYDNSEFWIRGISSFAGGTGPLVLVDGIPRSLNDIDPDEIQTFTLLKDAAATAVYGAEGANGVILITSKRGVNQKTVISYRGEYGVSEPTRLPEFVGAGDFMRLYNEALFNEGSAPMYSDELIARHESGQDPDLYPDVNWLNLLSDYSTSTRHTLNFRGGGEKAKFFISGSYFNQGGIFQQNSLADYNNNIGLNRYNLRSNVDFDVSPTTLLSVDLSGQYLETNYPGVGSTTIFQRMTIAPPNLFPMVFSDGTNAGHPVPSGNRVNPYNLLMESGYSKEWRSSTQSKVALVQDLDVITQGLSAKGVVSYDSYSLYTTSRTKTPAQYVASGRDLNGNLVLNQVVNEVPFGEPAEGNSGEKRIYLEASVNYNRSFNEKHDVGGMLLYYQKETQLHNQALAFRKQAYVGRGTYLYDNRYSLEVNFGITGSETFADGNRFGLFPAMGVAWLVDNEAFWKDSGISKVINGLKLRYSIGRTGNDDTGGERFLYRSSFNNAGGYPIGIGSNGGLNSIGGLVEGRFSAPGLTWEIEDKRNYGLDIDLFSNRINLQLNYFDNTRSSILLQRRTVSEAAGLRQAPWQNFGEVSNKGFDGSLMARENFGDFTVSLRGNLTYAKNKILEYDEVPQLYDWMNVTGTSLRTANLYVAERLYDREDFDINVAPDGTETFELKEGYAVSSLGGNIRPGDIKYVDLNGDGEINQFDQSRQIAKPSVPELIYGVGLNVDYKGFYANIFFQGAGSVSTVLGGSNGQGFHPFTWGVQETSIRKAALNRWSQDNPSQDVMFPRLRTSNFFHNTVASTWWLRDASFLRLKNVEIGYNFSKNLLDKLSLTSGRFYVMGNNLHVWDKIKMWDPEIGNENAGMNYPLSRNVTFGLELKL